jgi:hypothetical protein
MYKQYKLTNGEFANGVFASAITLASFDPDNTDTKHLACDNLLASHLTPNLNTDYQAL